VCISLQPLANSTPHRFNTFIFLASPFNPITLIQAQGAVWKAQDFKLIAKHQASIHTEAEDYYGEAETEVDEESDYEQDEQDSDVASIAASDAVSEAWSEAVSEAISEAEERAVHKELEYQANMGAEKRTHAAETRRLSTQVPPKKIQKTLFCAPPSPPTKSSTPPSPSTLPSQLFTTVTVDNTITSNTTIRAVHHHHH
jgi:hypothetical protein